MQSKRTPIKEPLSKLEVGDSHRFLADKGASVEITIGRLMKERALKGTPVKFRRDNRTEKNVLIITRVE